MSKDNKLIFVTGATGKQGGAVINHLLNNNYKVRALTRNPNKPEATSLLERGVDVIKGDMEKPGTFKDALKDVYGVFSVQNFWEHGYDGELHEGLNLVGAAKEAGIKHFVYSSVASAHRKTGLPHFEVKWVIEEHLRKSGLPYTIFRPVYFMQNLLMMKEQILEGRLIFAMEEDIPLQSIDFNNVGGFAEAAFSEPDVFLGKEIDIASDSKTFPEMAAILAGVMGRNIEYIKIDMDSFKKTFGEEYANMVEWFNNVGYNADIGMLRDTYDVELTSFKDWARKSEFAGKGIKV